MKNNNLTVHYEQVNLEEQFAKECKLINLKYEYYGYAGDEKWAIVSELSKEELMEKYPELVEKYIPFVLLSVKQGEAINEYNRIEDKHRKRRVNNELGFGFDEVTEYAHPELIQPNFIEKQMEEDFDKERESSKMRLFAEAMNSLTEKQSKYATLRFIKGMSARDIAKEEGISHQAVEKHINAAIKKFQNTFGDFFGK
ncbi:MAG: sigma-70 family RNA polymerase sigma factor [Clostridia bacterium]|uniref:sigma-70 family RNA polymerase sigma factor n=1 Tax=Blautia producta TaxID=33035 RepID=UPI0028A4A269|nr:sigma-70 family RNA polymerase sigma factor [Blautia coccoides]MDD3416977.1 sigma-70 family RNA polymerase sigma factor [Lachnospiraceae bacterium]MDT4376935.1 sigma-70 family RNA polymerase sigma factor [Blautia coccoides]NCC02158.1 sigma-70 family RNA polymerase sigma factor [Clostridia bacterium]